MVGLGNPGIQYHLTRHNLGYWAVDRAARLLCADPWMRRKQLLSTTVVLGGSEAILAKPRTWMNLSGSPVHAAIARWRVAYERLLVVCDDVALLDGRLRLRAGGSSGGHRGLESIIDFLGTQGFPRLRIGVGSGRHPGEELRDYVLEALEASEIPLYERAAERAAHAIRMVIEDGLPAAMTEYNQPALECGGASVVGETDPHPGGED